MKTVGNILGTSSMQGFVKAPATSKEVNNDFSYFLKDALNQVNKGQQASDKATEMLINGGDIELHDVMITAEKASIMMQTTMEVRNKAVEAYQEIMRMNM